MSAVSAVTALLTRLALGEASSGLTRARHNELVNRLGLRGERASGAVARLEYVRETYGSEVESLLLELYDRANASAWLRSSEPSPRDAAIPWLGRLLDSGERDQVIEGAAQLRPVLDWLTSEHTAVDTGRLTWSAAVAAQREWHESLKVADSGRYVPHEGELVREWPDGWELLRLTDLEVVEAEGESMGNCLGQGNYHEEVESGEYQLFSLRKPQVQPGLSRPVVDILVQSPDDRREALEQQVSDYQHRGWAPDEVTSLLLQLMMGLSLEEAREMSATSFAERLDSRFGIGKVSDDPWEIEVGIRITDSPEEAAWRSAPWDDLGSLVDEVLSGTSEEALEARAEMEMEGAVLADLLELKGRNNEPPHPRYRARTREALEAVASYLEVDYEALLWSNAGEAFPVIERGSPVWRKVVDQFNFWTLATTEQMEDAVFFTESKPPREALDRLGSLYREGVTGLRRENRNYEQFRRAMDCLTPRLHASSTRVLDSILSDSPSAWGQLTPTEILPLLPPGHYDPRFVEVLSGLSGPSPLAFYLERAGRVKDLEDLVASLSPPQLRSLASGAAVPTHDLRLFSSPNLRDYFQWRPAGAYTELLTRKILREDPSLVSGVALEHLPSLVLILEHLAGEQAPDSSLARSVVSTYADLKEKIEPEPGTLDLHRRAEAAVGVLLGTPVFSAEGLSSTVQGASDAVAASDDPRSRVEALAPLLATPVGGDEDLLLANAVLRLSSGFGTGPAMVLSRRGVAGGVRAHVLAATSGAEGAAKIQDEKVRSWLAAVCFPREFHVLSQEEVLWVCEGMPGFWGRKEPSRASRFSEVHQVGATEWLVGPLPYMLVQSMPAGVARLQLEALRILRGDHLAAQNFVVQEARGAGSLALRFESPWPYLAKTSVELLERRPDGSSSLHPRISSDVARDLEEVLRRDQYGDKHLTMLTEGYTERSWDGEERFRPPEPPGVANWLVKRLAVLLLAALGQARTASVEHGGEGVCELRQSSSGDGVLAVVVGSSGRAYLRAQTFSYLASSRDQELSYATASVSWCPTDTPGEAVLSCFPRLSAQYTSLRLPHLSLDLYPLSWWECGYFLLPGVLQDAEEHPWQRERVWQKDQGVLLNVDGRRVPGMRPETAVHSVVSRRRGR